MKRAERDLQNAKFEMGFFFDGAWMYIKGWWRCIWLQHLISDLPDNCRVEEELRRKAMELDKAYIPTRYANAIPEGVPFEVYTKEEDKCNIIC